LTTATASSAPARAQAPIGVIGLGFMGGAISRRLREAGFAVVGYDLDPGRLAQSAAAGVVPAASIAALARDCHTIVLAVHTMAQVGDALQACLGQAARTVLCTSTCEPRPVAALAARAAQAGVDFVEFPISGTSAQLAAGDAVGLLSGAPAAIAACGPVIAAICPRHIVVGAPGDAARAKLAINLVLQLNRCALAEGLVFAERLGLDTTAFLTTLRASAAYSQVMDTKGEKMLRQDYAPQSKIAQTLKDAELMLQEAAALRQELPLLQANAQLLRECVAEDGARDSAAVIEAIRRRRA
jgi:3-hydroxyisobutyrate dehydrogenase-like beta-hydroxyacid dehydrogenase